MASGKTHDKITYWTTAPVTAIAVATMSWVKGYFVADMVVVFAGCYLFAGLMFGPDLDIVSIQYKRWGWIKGIWIPYQKMIPHRSYLSHGAIAGTVIRILYVAVYIFTSVGILSLALLAIDYQVDVLGKTWQLLGIIKSNPSTCLHAFLGLEAGAMSHSFADWASTRFKKVTKKFKG